MKYNLSVEQLIKMSADIHCGDEILLSGTVYTARDAAHKRIKEIIENGGEPPFDLKNSVIYFAGPTPTRPGEICGSFGPTTSCRMDAFTPQLMDMGLFATIGKGGRSEEVRQAIIRNKGLYLLALGGAGAYAAKRIKSLKEIAFAELGCESVKKIELDNFLVYIGIDTFGNTLI